MERWTRGLLCLVLTLTSALGSSLSAVEDGNAIIPCDLCRGFQCNGAQLSHHGGSAYLEWLRRDINNSVSFVKGNDKVGEEYNGRAFLGIDGSLILTRIRKKDEGLFICRWTKNSNDDNLSRTLVHSGRWISLKVEDKSSKSDINTAKTLSLVPKRISQVKRDPPRIDLIPHLKNLPQSHFEKLHSENNTVDEISNTTAEENLLSLPSINNSLKYPENHTESPLSQITSARRPEEHSLTDSHNYNSSSIESKKSDVSHVDDNSLNQKIESDLDSDTTIPSTKFSTPNGSTNITFTDNPNETIITNDYEKTPKPSLNTSIEIDSSEETTLSAVNDISSTEITTLYSVTDFKQITDKTNTDIFSPSHSSDIETSTMGEKSSADDTTTGNSEAYETSPIEFTYSNPSESTMEERSSALTDDTSTVLSEAYETSPIASTYSNPSDITMTIIAEDTSVATITITQNDVTSSQSDGRIFISHPSKISSTNKNKAIESSSQPSTTTDGVSPKTRALTLPGKSTYISFKYAILITFFTIAIAAISVLIIYFIKSRKNTVLYDELRLLP